MNTHVSVHCANPKLCLGPDKFQRSLCQLPRPAGCGGPLDHNEQRAFESIRTRFLLRFKFLPSADGVVPGQRDVYPGSCRCITQDSADCAGWSPAWRTSQALPGSDVLPNSIRNDIHLEGSAHPHQYPLEFVSDVYVDLHAGRNGG